MSIRGGKLGYWEWREDGRLLFSDRWAEMLGHSSGELDQRFETWESRLHPDERDEVLESVQSHLSGRTEHFEAEHRMRSKRDRWIWVLSMGRVSERSGTGDALRMNGVMLDISERKAVAQELDQQLHQSSALNMLSRSISACRTVEAALEAAVDGIVPPVAPATIAIHLAKDGMLQLRKWRSWDHAVLDDPAKVSAIGFSLCEEAFKRQKSLYSEDIQRDADPKEEVQRIIHGFAALPLMYENEALGVIALGCITRRNFSAYDEFLQSVAAIIALGLKSALLDESLRDRVVELEKTIMARANDLADVNAQLREEIKDREKREGELKRFRTALDSSGDAIVILDLKTYLFVDANRTASKMLGYSLEQLRAMGPSDIDAQHDPEELESLLEEARTRGRLTTYETRAKTKDGDTLPVEVELKGFHQNGRDFLVGAVRDISARLEAQQSLLDAKTEAERASAAKSRFLARVSHEIRTPLNFIIGVSQVAAEEAVSDERKDAFQKILTSANGLLDIFNEIIDFSDLEQGDLTVEPMPFDMKELVEVAMGEITEKAIAKGLSFHSVLAPGFVPYRFGDPVRLLQILGNLLDNAVKFTESGGVTLEVDGDDEIRMRVSDTGIGIPEDKRELIFQSFVQGENAVRRRKFGGTGLGLTMAHQLAELMDGTLTLEADQGQGSAFSVKIFLPKVNVDQIRPIRGLSAVETMGAESTAGERSMSDNDKLRAVALLKTIDKKLEQSVIDEDALTELTHFMEPIMGGEALKSLTQALDAFDFELAREYISAILDGAHEE